MRAQLNGLKELIDGVLTITAAQVDGVNTVNPGDPATVDLSVIGSTLHFTFGIPRGSDGSNGADGTGVSGAVIDGATSLDPNQGATAEVNFDTGSQVLHFSFGIPRGQTGDSGPQGPHGTQGDTGPQGAQGPPGEISAAQLLSAFSETSNNSNGVGTLDAAFTNDPPTLADMEAMRAKMNELILALRR